MPDETLQAAFEIKTTCDEISRKLLRWHWEKKPGAHSLNALLEHIAQRQQESPEYYERMPDLSGKTSWSQLDTTLCMRVLLDPEKDAARPLDLLGSTEHPGAARRACNEAVEALEEGYAGTALRTTELEQYYRMAEDFLDRCGAKKPLASAAPEEQKAAPRSARPRSEGQRKASGAGSTSRSRSASNGRRNTGGARTSTAAARGAASAQKSPAPITRCWACWRCCWPWGCCCAGLG